MKFTVTFRGREMAHPERGHQMLQQVIADLAEIATPESIPRIEGRKLVMIMLPKAPKVHGAPRRRRQQPRARGRAPAAKPADKPEPAPKPRPPRRKPARERGDARGETMPKMKTNRAAAKRFKLTGTGRSSAHKALRGTS